MLITKLKEDIIPVPELLLKYPSWFGIRSIGKKKIEWEGIKVITENPLLPAQTKLILALFYTLSGKYFDNYVISKITGVCENVLRREKKSIRKSFENWRIFIEKDDQQFEFSPVVTVEEEKIGKKFFYKMDINRDLRKFVFSHSPRRINLNVNILSKLSNRTDLELLLFFLVNLFCQEGEDCEIGDCEYLTQYLFLYTLEELKRNTGKNLYEMVRKRFYRIIRTIDRLVHIGFISDVTVEKVHIPVSRHFTAVINRIYLRRLI